MVYTEYFRQALLAYQNQKNRLGYTFGLLSWFRHSGTLYPHIKSLFQALSKAKSVEHEKQILRAYFLDSKTKFNNHSFATYLLDILMESDKEGKENWEQFLPPEKKYVFYTGPLYRGMKIDRNTLQDFFNNGFSSQQHSVRLEDYANPNNMSVGVSTSKELSVALKYASTNTLTKGENRQQIRIPGYLLAIDYTGGGGVDIVETYKMRDDKFNQKLADPKKEVNIIGKISAKNIKGAYFIDPCNRNKKPTFIENPNYKSSPVSFFSNIALRLQHLFKPAPPPFAPKNIRFKPTPPPFAPNLRRV